MDTEAEDTVAEATVEVMVVVATAEMVAAVKVAKRAAIAMPAQTVEMVTAVLMGAATIEAEGGKR